jgi:hypothetical protein
MLDPNVLYEQVICTEVVDYHNNPLGVAKRMDWSVLHLVQGVQGWGSQSCRRGLYTVADKQSPPKKITRLLPTDRSLEIVVTA